MGLVHVIWSGIARLATGEEEREKVIFQSATQGPHSDFPDIIPVNGLFKRR